jgi:hypothetical protein
MQPSSAAEYPTASEVTQVCQQPAITQQQPQPQLLVMYYNMANSAEQCLRVLAACSWCCVSTLSSSHYIMYMFLCTDHSSPCGQLLLHSASTPAGSGLGIASLQTCHKHVTCILITACTSHSCCISVTAHHAVSACCILPRGCDTARLRPRNMYVLNMKNVYTNMSHASS